MLFGISFSCQYGLNIFFVDGFRSSLLFPSYSIHTSVCVVFGFLVCFFVWSLSSHSRVFHSNGDVTITGERLKILTNVRRSWPLSNEDNLACHTYCDTGHSFIWSSSRTRETHICCREFISGDYITCFNDIGLSRLEFKHPTFRMANALSDCTPPRFVFCSFWNCFTYINRYHGRW